MTPPEAFSAHPDPAVSRAEALLPCPFCGGEAEISSGIAISGEPEIIGDPFASCAECSVAIPGNTEAKAAAAWNRRASIQAEPVAVKALEWQSAGEGLWAGEPPLRYSIVEMSYGVVLRLAAVQIPDRVYHQTTFAAMEAAQADYEARIRSAIASPALSVETVNDDMMAALKDSAEILFHLGTAGKNPSQDEAIDAVRERVLAAIAKAVGQS